MRHWLLKMAYEESSPKPALWKRATARQSAIARSANHPKRVRLPGAQWWRSCSLIRNFCFLSAWSIAVLGIGRLISSSIRRSRPACLSCNELVCELSIDSPPLWRPNLQADSMTSGPARLSSQHILPRLRSVNRMQNGGICCGCARPQPAGLQHRFCG